MTTKTRNRKSTKPAQYHYIIQWKAKPTNAMNNFCDDVECMYYDSFQGSGYFFLDNTYDLHMKCTSREFANIRRYMNRHLKRKYTVNRYTDMEYYGDD